MVPSQTIRGSNIYFPPKLTEKSALADGSYFVMGNSEMAHVGYGYREPSIRERPRTLGIAGQIVLLRVLRHSHET